VRKLSLASLSSSGTSTIHSHPIAPTCPQAPPPPPSGARRPRGGCGWSRCGRAPRPGRGPRPCAAPPRRQSARRGRPVLVGGNVGWLLVRIRSLLRVVEERQVVLHCAAAAAAAATARIAGSKPTRQQTNTTTPPSTQHPDAQTHDQARAAVELLLHPQVHRPVPLVLGAPLLRGHARDALWAAGGGGGRLAVGAARGGLLLFRVVEAGVFLGLLSVGMADWWW